MLQNKDIFHIYQVSNKAMDVIYMKMQQKFPRTSIVGGPKNL